LAKPVAVIRQRQGHKKEHAVTKVHCNFMPVIHRWRKLEKRLTQSFIKVEKCILARESVIKLNEQRLRFIIGFWL
jgi:hypothetical protein